jgi:hypothetical protein
LLDGTYMAPLELEPELLPMFGQFDFECDGAVVLGVVVVPGVVVVLPPEAAYAAPPPTPIETTTAASAA